MLRHICINNQVLRKAKTNFFGLSVKSKIGIYCNVWLLSTSTYITLEECIDKLELFGKGMHLISYNTIKLYA